jgi:hypothetical protein
MLAVPTIIFMALRVNASLVFLSACLGAVLSQYVGAEANNFFNLFMPSLQGNDIKIVLVALPVVLTTIFMIRTVHGGRLLFNILPALGTSLLLAILIVPLLSDAQVMTVKASTTWHQIENLQALIVGVSALTCLFFIWLQRPKAGHPGGKKHHKHH